MRSGWQKNERRRTSDFIINFISRPFLHGINFLFQSVTGTFRPVQSYKSLNQSFKSDLHFSHYSKFSSFFLSWYETRLHWNGVLITIWFRVSTSLFTGPTARMSNRLAVIGLFVLIHPVWSTLLRFKSWLGVWFGGKFPCIIWNELFHGEYSTILEWWYFKWTEFLWIHANFLFAVSSLRGRFGSELMPDILSEHNQS